MSQRTRRARLSVENLEGRALLTAGLKLPGGIAALVSLPQLQGVKTDPAAVAAILAALKGGPGNEFTTLLRNQVPNLQTVIARFVLGQIQEFTTPGVAVKTPQFQSGFVGRHYDHLSLTAAGAILLRNGKIEFGAIMRGPFDEPVGAQVVFGVNRGGGVPIFGTRPAITPDATVTINVGPYGTHPVAWVTDLRTGAITPINPSQILVQGAVARVFVTPAQLPSRGYSLGAYRFAAWTSDAPGLSLSHVGSFSPETTMIPIGVQRA